MTELRTPLAQKGNLFRSEDESSITKAGILPLEPYVLTQTVIDLCREHPDRLVPYCSVHPKDPQKKEKLQNYLSQGCRALKLHPVIQDVHPEDVSYFDIMEIISGYDVPVLFHTGWLAFKSRTFGLIGNYRKIVEAFPRITFVMAHMNMFHSNDAIEFARKYPNVHLDASWQPVGRVRKAIDAIGSERVLLGSDWPYAKQKTTFDVMLKATGSDTKAAENVFYRNAMRLLKISESRNVKAGEQAYQKRTVKK
jgi:predicted TIM-barrel fold metal-dependent hydrolase